MLIPDVNILLGAHQSSSLHHVELLRWLNHAAVGDEVLGVSDVVLSGVVRIATNARVFERPSTPDEAISFCDEVRAAPASQIITAGSGHWAIFADLVTQHRLRDNDVPDAYLAALALENRATFVTRDRGFGRFAGLKLLDPTS